MSHFLSTQPILLAENAPCASVVAAMPSPSREEQVMLTFAPATGAPLGRSTVPLIDASGSPQAKNGKVRRVMAAAERKRGRCLMVSTFSNNDAMGVVVRGNSGVSGLAASHLAESCDAGGALMSGWGQWPRSRRESWTTLTRHSAYDSNIGAIRQLFPRDRAQQDQLYRRPCHEAG
jgi:hypothetical protein